MTIAQAIAQIDARKPNQYTSSDKIGWLSELDLRFWGEVVNSHEGYEEYADFEGYSGTASTGTELLIPDPYSAVYLSWLASRIDYYNAEFTRFDNTAAVYNTEYQAAANYWNREHLPLQKNRTIAK